MTQEAQAARSGLPSEDGIGPRQEGRRPRDHLEMGQTSLDRAWVGPHGRPRSPQIKEEGRPINKWEGRSPDHKGSSWHSILPEALDAPSHCAERQRPVLDHRICDDLRTR